MTMTKYSLQITEMQRRLIMQALSTTLANNNRHRNAEGELGAATHRDWMQLICLFGALEPEWQPD